MAPGPSLPLHLDLSCSRIGLAVSSQCRAHVPSRARAVAASAAGAGCASRSLQFGLPCGVPRRTQVRSLECAWPNQRSRWLTAARTRTGCGTGVAPAPGPARASAQGEQVQVEADEELREAVEDEVGGILEEADSRAPVTIITGFLGSGKTTLLNYMLKADHGKRIAVIENEFGEVDIDGSLVADQVAGSEDVVILNNGCLCCTVRGDLVRMLSDLLRNKRDKFDHIVIETTGLANPAPIIQTFFLEEELAEGLKLDGVVTVTDAKHVGRHFERETPGGVVNEAVEQIAFADRIIVNKVDLVEEVEVDRLLRQIRGVNSMARVRTATYGQVDIDYVLGIGGFDLERVEKDVQPHLLDEQAPSAHQHEHQHEGEQEQCGECGGEHGSHQHHHHHHGEHEEEHPGEHEQQHEHKHHDPGVSSVSVVCEGNLDLDKINDWLGVLLEDKSDDIYRMKGVLSIDKCKERFVFQGVHALFEGAPDRRWRAEEKRENRIVFIGRNLNREELVEGFKACLVH